MRLMPSRYSGHVQPGIEHAPSLMSDALASDGAWAMSAWWQRSQCRAPLRPAGRINTARDPPHQAAPANAARADSMVARTSTSGSAETMAT